MPTIVTLSILTISLNVVLSAKILGLFPPPVNSHRNLYVPLVQELVQRGHDVTVVSPYEEKTDSKNGSLRSIVLTGFVEWMRDGMKNMRTFEQTDTNVFQKLQTSIAFLEKMTEMTLEHKEVQKLIHSKETFDVVIITEVLNHALKALAPHFKAPLVSFSTVGACSLSNLLVGNPSPPSYVPDIFSDYSSQMTFLERLTNSFTHLYTQVCFNWYVYPKHSKLMKKYIPGEYDFDQVIHNISIVLLNSHPSINQPVPLVPNMIEIGGFHIKPPKQLPQDLQEYLDNAPNGVIYFSMGSNLKSAELPLEKRDAFLKTFAKLKQKVIWKWEEDVLPGKPDNVKLGKWLPQSSILAHPNIRLFITHGGLLSTTETVYHGVPVLAIPIFGDQKQNAQIAVNLGFGLSLSFEDVNEEALTRTIVELLNNPKYKEIAKARSKYFHDRVRKPMETAIYWIEYVIRHRGAAHLRVAGIDLPWYQYILLDIVAVLVLGILLTCCIVAFVCKKLCCRNSQRVKIKAQ
ncbi:UDP-glycosyltransferase UGT5-like [Zophobas morio]|uniref:UDP-glycosyltransferase UGT5-like n=1 Tax=Zophobas morio TaxID=2755281 RepID=UPI0030839E1E